MFYNLYEYDISYDWQPPDSQSQIYIKTVVAFLRSSRALAAKGCLFTLLLRPYSNDRRILKESLFSLYLFIMYHRFSKFYIY